MDLFNQITIPTRSLDYFIEITETPTSRTFVLWHQPDTLDGEATIVPLSKWFDETEDEEGIDLYRASLLYYNKQDVSSVPELLSVALAKIAYYVDEQIRIQERLDYEQFVEYENSDDDYL